MRMWMVNPRIMCRQHLQGEHGELHKFLSSWRKGHSITGRVLANQMEPEAYKTRHDELAAEMLRRGYNHKSPLEQPDFSYLPESDRKAKVNVATSLKLLLNRCPECCKRMKEDKAGQQAHSPLTERSNERKDYSSIVQCFRQGVEQ